MAWRIKERLRSQLARERGAIARDWGGRASVVLLYPNAYRVGMGNLAVHSVYAALNASDSIACERAFLPDRLAMHEHMASRTPVLSMESQRPLRDFDVIAITASFENDYLNIIPMLSMSRIPHRRADRTDDHPLIIAGGAAPTLNPLPLSAIADVVFAGEFEAAASDMMRIIESRAPKGEAAAALSKIQGAVTGEGSGAVKRMHAEDIDSFKTQTVIHSRDAEFGDMHLIEVQRGCPRGCRFCATPVIYGPTRMRSAASVMAMFEEGLAHRKRMGLVGADILSHPDFETIARAMLGRDATFSPSSVRVDAIDDGKASLLHEAGHRSIALGIEAGSERLRRTLGKGLADARILEAVSTLARSGIAKQKLYFMIGLPDEGDDDVAAIARLAALVRDEIRRAAPRTHRTTAVDITVTPFVPKPGTPFAQRKFAGEQALKRKVKQLRRALAKESGIVMRTDSAVDAAIESLIAMGDSTTVEFLEEANRLGSARAALRAD